MPRRGSRQPRPARRPDADRADGVDGDRLAAAPGRRRRDGGVILFPAEGTDPDALGAEVAKLRRAAERSAAPAPLVAIDQEGGDVERLPSLPPSRSATAIGAARPRAPRARRPARRSPVSASISTSSPVFDLAGPALGSRAFAADPDEVAERATAFAGGLQDAGVAATAKHFPGLGAASTNTDVEATPIQLTDAQLEREPRPVKSGAPGGGGLGQGGQPPSRLDRSRRASRSGAGMGGWRGQGWGLGGGGLTEDFEAGGRGPTGMEEGGAAVGAAGAGAALIRTGLRGGGAAQAGWRQAFGRHGLGGEGLGAWGGGRKRCANGSPVSRRAAP